MRRAFLSLTQLTLTQKIAATAAAVLALGSVTAYTTYAAFTSSANVTHITSTGTVDLLLGTAGTAANRLTVGASDLAAGDSLQRAVNLTNNGTIDWATVTLDVTAPTTTSLLDTDTVEGLQLQVDRCSVAWTETALANGGYTYTCAGTQTSLVASTPVIVAGQDLGALSSLTAGQTDYLRVTLTLPATAGNTLQNQTSELVYTFTATQRAGTDA